MNRQPFGWFLPAVFLMAMLAASCHQRQATTIVTDSISDDYDRTVVVPHQPRRIVSTSPAVTEIIFALGGQHLLIGRTEYCTYPPEAADIENIGGISNLNVEKIVSLHPDLVISGSMIPEKSIQQLATLGVPAVCVIEKQHFDGLYENIGRIGALIGYAGAADSLIAILKSQVGALPSPNEGDDAFGGVARPSVYYVVGYGSGGNFTAGGDSFINDIILMAGGKNIADSLHGWSYSIEALMNQDPDYIIVRKEDSAAFCNMHPYNRLSAVHKGNVIGIESSTIDLQVPRNIDAVKYLRGKMK